MTRRASGVGEGWVAIELCAGLGGIGIGLRRLGIHVAKAYDSWDEAVAIYNHNAPEAIAVTCNLLCADGRRTVASDAREIEGVDLLAAGPPCEGFSQLRNGYHDGRNGHNRVLRSMPDFVALVRPRMFLLENVPDLARHRGGKTFRSLLEGLAHPARSLRYRIEHRIYDAALYGVPQVRRRMLILGVRDRSLRGHLPESGPDLARLYAAVRHGGEVPSDLNTFLVSLKDPENFTLTSARQALSDLPLLGPGEPEAKRHYASTPSTAFQRWARQGGRQLLQDTQTPAVRAETLNRLRLIPPGGCARAIPSELLNGLSRRYDSAYRRLHPDAPSTALSTKYDCVYHYAVGRSLSVREYARLQGLPDSITFPAELACRRSAYDMIGNSVPPLLIERVLGSALRG